MRVRVRLFARYREALGRDRLDVDLPEGGTVESAWSAIADRHPELAPFRAFTLFAVGHDYVAADHRLAPDDELCLFPPVSGGSAPDVFRVVTDPLSPDAIAARVDEPGAGGIVIFLGVVRNQTDGRPVKYLEYEAHAEGPDEVGVRGGIGAKLVVDVKDVEPKPPFRGQALQQVQQRHGIGAARDGD